jgi:hypothetical protein
LVHVLLISALGGAHLERYLLPAWPIFFIAAARAFASLPGRRRVLGPVVMAAGLFAGLFYNPPYPFPFENNLTFTKFVELQQNAAQYLSRHFPGTIVTTAWPLSDALQRPEFGYVYQPVATRKLADFRASSLAGIEDPQVLVLYSREWEPRRNWFRIPAVEQFWQRFFGYERPITVEQCRRRFNLHTIARWEHRGLWLEILGPASGAGPLPASRPAAASSLRQSP